MSGETDYATDGTRVLAAVGGNVMATLVVGTGCSLSALTAGFAAKAEDPLVATIACCQFVKRAAEIAGNASRGRFLPRRLPRRALYAAARKLS